jgi:glycosyltransferase involved in cell wall biosynthesis
VSLKIVQIIPALDAGGAERTVVEITRAVVEAGGQALCITAGGRLEGEVIAAGGSIAHLPVHSKNPYVMWRNAHHIARIARAFDADLLHARSRAPAWSTKAACKRLGLPFVTTYHGTYNAGSALKRYYNSIMAASDAVIANSGFIARRIIDEHAIEENRITVIPRGIAPLYFDIPETMDAVGSTIPGTKLNINRAPGEALIVLPGRLTRWKGQETAIKALAQLHQDGHKAHLVLAGDAQGRDSYVEALRQQVTQAGVETYVHFCGHVENMAALYGGADMVLSASIEPEAFGRVAVESQASARMTVASAHGGTLETVLDGQSGFHFKPGNAADLAGVLKKVMMLDTDTHRQIRLTARKHALAHYSREAMCAKTLGLYHHLICPRKGN